MEFEDRGEWLRMALSVRVVRADGDQPKPEGQWDDGAEPVMTEWIGGRIIRRRWGGWVLIHRAHLSRDADTDAWRLDQRRVEWSRCHHDQGGERPVGAAEAVGLRVGLRV